MIEQLTTQRDEIVKNIKINEDLIRDTQDRIYTLKRQEKILNKAIEALKETEPKPDAYKPANPSMGKETITGPQATQ